MPTIAELKVLLREQGLPVSGNKATLMERLAADTATKSKKRAAPATDSKKSKPKKKIRTSLSSASSSSSESKVGLVESLTEPSWKALLKSELKAPYFEEIVSFVHDERKSHQVYPPNHEVFTAFNETPFSELKVVIIGQDPYFNPGQGHGLCFSVKKGIKIPPSLNRIYKELDRCIPGWTKPKHGYLLEWAQQGVLMLNATLTVRKGKANSHKKCGWQTFTDNVISLINEKCEGIVFMLWGGFAQKKGQHLDRDRHHVLECPHPSPMAGMGWHGNAHFSTANELLEGMGKDPVDWSISP